MKITGLFSSVLAELIAKGELPELETPVLDLAAHNIAVMGHMWAFRRRLLTAQYSIDEYIEIQTGFILNEAMLQSKKSRQRRRTDGI